jgi:type II secretory pathway component GspD/PulD (secretin)
MLPQGSQEDLPPTLKGKIQFIEDPNTGFVTLLGDPEDIELVMEIMSKIAKESDLAQPVVDNIPLANIQSEAFEERIQELYDSSYQSTKGPAEITAIASPNMFLVIAQPEGVEAVRKIVAGIDVQEDMVAAEGSHESFRLKYISATDAKLRLDAYFGQGQDNGSGDNQLSSAPVVTIADFRSNIITVKGSKQFIADARRYLTEIDVIDSPTTNEVRVFSLKNTIAEEMALVIQDAVNGQQTNSGQGYNPNPDGQNTDQGDGNLRSQDAHLRSPALSLKTIGKNGEVITSGIMFDVRVTADRNSNSLVVAAPTESMALIEELI